MPEALSVASASSTVTALPPCMTKGGSSLCQGHLGNIPLKAVSEVVRRILAATLASVACWIPLIFFLIWCGGIIWGWHAASSWCQGQKKCFEWKLNRNSLRSHAEHRIGWPHKFECQIARMFYQVEMWCFISMLSTHKKKHAYMTKSKTV